LLYFRNASLKALLKKAIGFSNPSLFFCKIKTTIVCSNAKDKIIKSFVMSGLIERGVVVKANFTSLQDFLASVFHFISTYFFIL